MKGFWGLVIAVILSAGHADAEIWSCAIKEKGFGTNVQQYRRDGNVLEDLTMHKFLHRFIEDTDKSHDYLYNILLDNNYALIAELDSAKTYSDKATEIYVANVVIDKETGHFIRTTIVSHLPKPDEIETEYGSCTVDK